MSNNERGGFYATIPAPVLDDPTLGYASMVLYAKIVNYSRSSGFCYAKNSELLRAMERVDPMTGALSGVTERTLQGWLAELRDAGHIQIDTGPLPVGADGAERVGRRIFIGGFLPKNALARGGEKICTPENNFAGGVKNFSPPIKGSNNNINKQKPPIVPHEIAKKIDAYAGEDEALRVALYGFAEQRAKRGSKKAIRTIRQLNLLLGKLDRLGRNSAERVRLLDEATEHGWDSVYADERQPKPCATPSRADAGFWM